MRIRIEIDEHLQEEEILIRCQELTERVADIQRAITGLASEREQLVFYKNDKEYYLPLESILFFETEGSSISAHTAEDIFKVKYRLYELESILPRCFVRVSKSTILNRNKVYSIDRNLTASSVVQFQGTHKQVFVSRNYYKVLKMAMEEKRMR